MKKAILCGLIFSMMLVFAGCQKAIQGTEQGAEKSGGTAPDSKYTLDYIKENLQGQNNVSLITVSPNEKYVAYIVGGSIDNDLEEPPKLHIWQVGEAAPVSTDIDEEWLPVCELWWAPHNDYLLVDIGSSTERGCDLYAVEGVKKIDTLAYTGEGMLFSPDGNRILYTGLSEISSIKENYISASSANDLILYDLAAKKKQVLFAGTKNIDYMAEGWLDNQTISYKKVEWKSELESYWDLMSKDTVYNYDLRSKQSTIDTEKTNRKYTNERFGFSIEYPGYFGDGEGSTNGDGRSFVSPDGSFSFKVWGERNDSGKTPQSVYDDLLKRHENISSDLLEGNQFRVQWDEGDQTVEEIHIVNDSVDCVLEIRYPLNKKMESNEVYELVCTLTGSFKVSQEPNY